MNKIKKLSHIINKVIYVDRLKLKELINTAINKLQDDKYRNDTIEDYKFTWKKFYEMCELFNVEYFDYNIAMKFLEKYYHIDIKNGKGRTHTRRMRAMHILNSLDKNEKIGIYKKVLDKKIPNSYRGVFNEFEEFLIKEKYVQSTINDFKNTLCKFFQFLNFNKIDSINKVKINDIYKFINFINTKNYSQATVYAIKYKLKYFFQYLFENGKFNYSGNDIFPRIAKFDRLKLPSYYSMDDINKIIEQVDTNTKRGKRDLAILLLATVYGLRNSDIVHLKKENIIWNQNKIELIQYKTKRLLELPLTDNVKFAILDYLKNNDIKNIIKNRLKVYKKLLDETIKNINNNYEKSILYYSKIKGGLFIYLKFNNEVDTNVFENGSHYYIDKNHNNETRINICSLLNND